MKAVSLKQVYMFKNQHAIADLVNDGWFKTHNEEDHLHWMLVSLGIVPRNYRKYEITNAMRKQALPVYREVRSIKEALVYVDGQYTPKVVNTFTLGDHDEEVGDYTCSACGTRGDHNIHLGMFYQLCNVCKHIERINFMSQYEDACYEIYEMFREGFVADIDELNDKLTIQPDGYVVEGSNLGWQKRSGGANIGGTGQEVYDFLTDINTNISVTGEVHYNGEIHCTRYHHDAPTGESISFYPAVDCDYGGGDDLIKYDDLAQAKHCANILNILEGHDHYEYVSDDGFMWGIMDLCNMYNEHLYEVLMDLKHHPMMVTEAMASGFYEANQLIED